jgi:hypothetical protein
VGKHQPVRTEGQEAFGHAEGEKVGLVDFNSESRSANSTQNAFRTATPNKITSKFHGPPGKDEPWETYIEKDQYDEVNHWFSRFTAERKKKLGHEGAAATVAMVNAEASVQELHELRKQGRAAADGCPMGVGSYGWDQMPNLIETVVVDNNKTVVIMLNNLDYANRYMERDIQAWQKLKQKFGANKLEFGSHMDYNLCPRYSGNFEGTRLSFEGQSGFSCVFADGTVTKPLDKGPKEVTCTTVLTVWCPIPLKLQQQLRAGKKVVDGVQLISSHHDMDLPAATTTTYPVAQLCPQQPIPPKAIIPTKVKLAGCAYFDPQFDTEENFEEWILWNIAVGVGHVFVYYMEGSRPDFPSFRGEAS